MNQAGSFCTHCGASLKPSSRFCPKCGAPVSPPQPASDLPGSPAALPPAQSAAQFAPAPPAPLKAAPKRRSLAWLVLLAAILGVGGLACCLVIGLFWAYPRWFESDTQATSAVVTAEVRLPTAAPTAAPTQPATEAAPSPTPAPPQVPLPSVNYGGASFSYDPSLASQVLAESIPAANPADAPGWDVTPEHVSFKFVGYPLYPDAFHEPRILVFPAEAYAALSPQGGQTIDELHAFLAQKPATLAPDQTIPFLPIWNAGQVMQANIAYLDFQNGSGVRFLTHYAQDIYPVSSRSLFYTFQGLSDDGRYYISAVLPVSNAILPDESSVVVDQAFVDNFASYIAGVEQELSAAPASSFVPDLALLDEMIRSILVK